MKLPRINIAIVSPSITSVTESFIKAHIDFIGGSKIVLYGQYPNMKIDGYSLSELYPEPNRAFEKLESLLPYHIAFRIKHKRRLERSPKKLVERFLITKNIRVVLAEYGFAGSAFVSVCRKLGIPLIVHFHGCDAYRKTPIEKHYKAYKEMFDYVSYVVVVSRDMERQLLGLGASQSKIVYNPYGSHPQFAKLMPDYYSNQLLSVGRFVDKKAPYLTLGTFRIVLGQFPELRLVMVGDGPLLNTCKNLSKSWGIEDKVNFPGILPHGQILSLMAQSFCFIQHSVVADDGDSEGTPVAVLEAGAAGLPVISTYHAGIPDVVIHEETGFLVDEFDVKGMANYVKILADDREKAKAIGEKARKHIKENFSMGKHIGTLEQLINMSVENYPE